MNKRKRKKQQKRLDNEFTGKYLPYSEIRILNRMWHEYLVAWEQYNRRKEMKNLQGDEEPFPLLEF
jgi:hypothetical protein